MHFYEISVIYRRNYTLRQKNILGLLLLLLVPSLLSPFTFDALEGNDGSGITVMGWINLVKYIGKFALFKNMNEVLYWDC